MSHQSASNLAIITGASSGIGAVYADRLARRGHALLLVARRRDRLDALAAHLRATHASEVNVEVADLVNAHELEALAQRIETAPLGVLVNNAGAGGLGPLAQASPDTLDRTLKLNVTALTRLSHAALRSFTTYGPGTLINIGSVLAHMASPRAAIYSGSKAYVLNFTQSLQLEFANSGARVQLVLPGPVRTEFFSAQGLSDDAFPAASYLDAEQLVDAALHGLDAGETITAPSVADAGLIEALETARGAFARASLSGRTAARYAAPA